MKKLLAAVAVAALGLGPVACNKSPEGGTPGTKDTFKISAPDLPTTVKKGETRMIDLKLTADAGFTKRKITLKAEHPKAVSTEFKPSSVELVAGQDAKVQLEVKADKDATPGDITVQVTGTPESGTATSVGVKVKVE